MCSKTMRKIARTPEHFQKLLVLLGNMNSQFRKQLLPVDDIKVGNSDIFILSTVPEQELRQVQKGKTDVAWAITKL